MHRFTGSSDSADVTIKMASVAEHHFEVIIHDVIERDNAASGQSHKNDGAINEEQFYIRDTDFSCSVSIRDCGSSKVWLTLLSFTLT